MVEHISVLLLKLSGSLGHSEEERLISAALWQSPSAELIQQMCCFRLLDVLLTFVQDRPVLLGVAAPGLSSRTRRRAEMSPVGLPALAQHKVVVGRGAHGIKHVGFVWDLEL